jgi:hypothetical protein
MLLAAALISVAISDPQAPVQPPPPVASSSTTASDSKPWTVQGVRAAVAGRPVIDCNVHDRDEQGSPVAMTFRSDRSSWRSQVASDWQEGWSAGATQTWHQEFLAMTGPRGYGGPYYGSTNGERLLAVASSVAIGYAVAGLASVIERTIASPLHHKVVKYKADRKQKKIEKVRTEIRAELAELERLNAAARGSGQTGLR